MSYESCIVWMFKSLGQTIIHELQNCSVSFVLTLYITLHGLLFYKLNCVFDVLLWYCIFLYHKHDNCSDMTHASCTAFPAAGTLPTVREVSWCYSRTFPSSGPTVGLQAFKETKYISGYSIFSAGIKQKMYLCVRKIVATILDDFSKHTLRKISVIPKIKWLGLKQVANCFVEYESPNLFWKIPYIVLRIGVKLPWQAASWRRKYAMQSCTVKFVLSLHWVCCIRCCANIDQVLLLG